MSTIIHLFIKEQLRLCESTRRIPDLDRSEILQVLNDILGTNPLITYTEKLAGQNFELIIKNGRTLGLCKPEREAGEQPQESYDLGGTARALRSTGFHHTVNAEYMFEVIKAENRPDYIDYAIGDKNIAVELTGKLKPSDAKFLNSRQPYVKFLCQQDILKRPKPLTPELKRQLQDIYDKVSLSSKLSVIDKRHIEMLISKSLIQIFGPSIFGGPPEGIFATHGNTSFKIPEFDYAEIQKMQAPIYAVFSHKSEYTSGELISRFAALSQNPSLLMNDKLISGLHNYLQWAAKVHEQNGYRTFFTHKESQRLLQIFAKILAGESHLAYSLVEQVQSRVRDKRNWVVVGS